MGLLRSDGFQEIAPYCKNLDRRMLEAIEKRNNTRAA
jgi:hypothetical protein